MNAHIPMDQVIRVKATVLGIDLRRKLIDLPNLTLVELDMPEYERNGLGRMVASTIRYEFTDTGGNGCEAMSIGADDSRAHVVYEDMNPTVLGTFSEVQQLSPSIAKMLYERCYGPEMVAIGVLRGLEMGINPGNPESVGQLVAYLDMYHRRATWLEAHALEVCMSNAEASMGNHKPFDWARLFPTLETLEC